MRPVVVFVCVKNGGKSQMAAALARWRAGDALDVRSAGTRPGGTLNEESRRSVEELGASFEGEYAKPLDGEVMEGADLVVLVGGEAEFAPEAGSQAAVERWETDEPSLRGIRGEERMRLIRDDIDARVRSLLAQWGIPDLRA